MEGFKNAGSILVLDGAAGVTDSGWIEQSAGFDFSLWGHGATVEVQVSPLSKELAIPTPPEEHVVLGSVVFGGDPSVGPLEGPAGPETDAILEALTLPFVQIRFVLTAGTGKAYFTRYN